MAKKKAGNQKQTSKFRQPIVAVMGHVDHGKTTFLDSVRGTRVADKEHGGITQNTRVHEITTKSGNRITFIDTPGHEAFSSMRERGARVTDFVLLMVAADDGVQPQTKESIEFAQQNNVPIIVAINKVDVEGADPKKIKTSLSSFGVQVEEFGGEVLAFEISAKQKKGLDELLEGIELLAELNQLSPVEPKEGVTAEAFVLESNLHKNLGHAAVCILKAGNLDSRMIGFTADSEFNVRAYLNEDMKPVKEVHTAQPFTVTGLSGDLVTGEIINFTDDKKVVKEVQEKLKSGEVSEDKEEEVDISADDLFAQLLMERSEAKEGVEQKELFVLVRASTQGTLEAVKAQLDELETEESKVSILDASTGVVTPDDITRAKLAKAIVLTFQAPTPTHVLALAKREKVLVRDYEIIYEMIDEIADALDSMDGSDIETIELAKLKVKGVFELSNGSIVAGGDVIEGTFKRGHQVLIERGDVEIAKTKVKSIRQGKNEIKEAKKGLECGLLLEQKIEGIEEGDIVVAYRTERR